MNFDPVAAKPASDAGADLFVLRKKMGHGEIILLHGNSHNDLYKLVADRLGVRNTGTVIRQNTSQETMVEIGESVRGKDVYILQTGGFILYESLCYSHHPTGTKDVNNDIMEMLILCYACKTSSAKTITGVIPYMPYSKQSKMRFRSCIVSKLVAKMMVNAGFNRILTVDLRAKEVQGFFDVPVDNLRAVAFLTNYIQREIKDYANAVLVAKDAHATRRCVSISERLRLPVAVIHGRQRESDSDSEDFDRAPSPPPRNARFDVFNLMPTPLAKESLPMTVIGEVSGKTCIVIDDMIDEVEPFSKVAQVLKEAGALAVYICATHGILSAEAPQILNQSPIDGVIVTNTVPHDEQKLKSTKIRTVDISLLICEAIRRIHYDESMSYLYKGVTDGD